MGIWKNIFGTATPTPTETVDAKKPRQRAAVAKPSIRKVEPKAPPLRKARQPKMPEHSTGKTYAHNIAAATAARMTKRSGGKEKFVPTQLGRSDQWTIVGPIKQYIPKPKKTATPSIKKALQVEGVAAALEGASRANAAVTSATTSLKQIGEYAEMGNDGILGNLVKDALEDMAKALHVTPAKVVTIRKPKEAALPIAK
jgi:hypothetical protein